MRKKHRIIIKAAAIILAIIFSNLFLQWCQNQLSADLALKFAFSWHTEKFFLGSLVLLTLFIFLCSLFGSLLAGSSLYAVVIGGLGLATYLKMKYRMEPIYPDDLKMISQLGFFKEVLGLPFFFLIIVVLVGLLVLIGYQFYRSFFLAKKKQVGRVLLLVVSMLSLFYISYFNNENNLLRKAYNKTALWIPYSQKMNYYNTGFVGGFLYNMRVKAMEEPADYSKKKIQNIVDQYQKKLPEPSAKAKEKPNIVYVMSESFSDPAHLKGLTITGEPLKDYYAVANQTYSGKMLSQNYGGGTANIEFSALTGFSMSLLTPQMTSPYTMLVPKMTELPSLVFLTAQRGYQTTAIHPYDTSMYKRKDVYQVMGFDHFIDQDTIAYTDKIDQNPYISDKAAYQQVMDILEKKDQPQMVHLVTMQTHMPYEGKYQKLGYQVNGVENTNSLENYLQDISYSAKALKNFIQEVEKIPERTLIVFWGDHLPGIYSDELQAQNSRIDLRQTQFLMVDSKNKWDHQKNQVLSPTYFAPLLMEKADLALTPYYALLLDLHQELPAFERKMYFIEGDWHKELALDKQQEKIYHDYQLIQYDILQGEQYSLKMDFFE